MTIQADRLPTLDHLFLRSGVGDWDPAALEKRVCIMQAVAYISGEGSDGTLTDRPQCASPILTRYGITLNDRLNDEQRQALKPLIPLIVGTRDDGKDARRQEIHSQWLMSDWLPKWLRLANLEDLAIKAEQSSGLTGVELTTALRAIRDLTWKERKASRARLTEQIKARLAERGAAVAAAVAAAAAAADAAADAAAVAAADAVADAVADLTADPWGKGYRAVYKAVCDHIETSDRFAAIRALRDEQISAGVDLFRALIVADPA